MPSSVALAHEALNFGGKVGILGRQPFAHMKTKPLISDPNYHGHVNGLPPDDKRLPFFLKQRAKQGFDDTETWSLYSAISHFILPRLKRFKEIPCGFPAGLSMDKWDAILGKMVKAFELIVEDKCPYSDVEDKQITEGLDLFRQWFFNLWT